MQKLQRMFSLLLILCWLAGCGYHLPSVAGQSGQAAVKTLNIPIFANKTFKTNLEAQLVNSLVDEFSLRRNYRVISGQDADLTLSGTVLSYGITAISYTAADTVREYRATVTAEAVLRQTNTQKVLWKGIVSWSQDYPVNEVIALQQNSEEAAIREISRRLAQQIYLRVVDDF